MPLVCCCSSGLAGWCVLLSGGVEPERKREKERKRARGGRDMEETRERVEIKRDEWSDDRRERNNPHARSTLLVRDEQR